MDAVEKKWFSRRNLLPQLYLAQNDIQEMRTAITDYFGHGMFNVMWS
jgi:hypothetical protein